MKKINWAEATVLVTGGTGTFGRKFVEIVLREKRPRKLIVFSRDELKQHEMRQVFPDTEDSPMRYFLGDVRDRDRLNRAFHGVDVVVHAAALKQVPACEYNPFEAVLTNIMGAKNVIDAAIDQGVPRVLGISSDKAVNPVNLYGATKLCAEKLFIQGNAYSSRTASRFSCARYGNVVGSRGSVIPLFALQRRDGRITVTDRRMTRFMMTIDQGARFVIQCIERMQGAEVFVPKISSTGILDLAAAVAPGCTIEEIGVRPGEKIHEILISEHEQRNTVELDDMFVICPTQAGLADDEWSRSGKPLPDGFTYSSDGNAHRLSVEELREMIDHAIA